MQTLHTKINRPLSTTAKIFILLIPLLIIAAFVTFFTNIFVMLVICLLFALVLNPIVDYTQSLGIARSLSILIVYVFIALIIYASITVIVPSIVEQSSELQKSYKEFEVSEKLKTVEKWLEKNLPFMKKGDIMKELESTFKASYTK
jgi:predicted PurR-regulated permease PerM